MAFLVIYFEISMGGNIYIYQIVNIFEIPFRRDLPNHPTDSRDHATTGDPGLTSRVVATEMEVIVEVESQWDALGFINVM